MKYKVIDLSVALSFFLLILWLFEEKFFKNIFFFHCFEKVFDQKQMLKC